VGFALTAHRDLSRGARAAGASRTELRARLAAARKPIEAKAADHDRRLGQLMDQWDREVDGHVPAADRRKTLEALRTLLLERTYVDNLLATLQREEAE